MRIQKITAALLLVILLSGCVNMGTVPPEQEDEEDLSIAALFQTENGDALHGSAAYLSTEANSDYYQVDNDGTVSIFGLPRNGELLLTLFDQQQKVQGAMTLSFGQGAVIDAMTGEDGVGHITVRNDTADVGKTQQSSVSASLDQVNMGQDGIAVTEVSRQQGAEQSAKQKQSPAPRMDTVEISESGKAASAKLQEQSASAASAEQYEVEDLSEYTDSELKQMYVSVK